MGVESVDLDCLHLSLRGRFAADQLLAAWRQGSSTDELIVLFRELARSKAELRPALVKNCIAVMLASAGVPPGPLNVWLRQ